MRNLTRSAALLIAGLLLAMPALAQNAKKPPKPLQSPSQALLESWNEIGRKLIAIAEDLPEDKYDYKPNPASRTFVAQLLHASAAMYYFTNPAQGKKAPQSDDPNPADFKTRAQVVAYVKKAVQDGAEVIKTKGDAGLRGTVVLFGQTFRLSDLAYAFVEHSGEHYGQLVVYYRINGLVPPESQPRK
jgi:uncharacterized damage-inducible protein DinB